jgi:hypothetical protein
VIQTRSAVEPGDHIRENPLESPFVGAAPGPLEVAPPFEPPWDDTAGNGLHHEDLKAARRIQMAIQQPSPRPIDDVVDRVS